MKLHPSYSEYFDRLDVERLDRLLISSAAQEVINIYRSFSFFCGLWELAFYNFVVVL